MADERAVPLMLTIVLLAAAGAGCLDDGPEQDAGTDGPGDEHPELIEIPWGLESCRASWWLAPASSEALREHLPEGFEPAPTPQLPGIDMAAGLDAYLGFDAFECASGIGLNGTLGPITFGSVFTRVIPPDEHTVEGLDGGYFFRWEVLIPDEPRHGRLSELGLAVRKGDAQVEAQSPAGSPGPWQNNLELEDLGSFTLTGTTLGPETQGEDVPWAAFTPAGDQIATWRATATDLTASNAWGVWTVEPGSWMAEVLGAEQGTGAFSVGTWSITDASLVIPARELD